MPGGHGLAVEGAVHGDIARMPGWVQPPSQVG